MIKSLGSTRMVLFIFMICTFAIGMTEYVVTGLLTQLSNDLNVPISTTGLLLSVYAISVAVFGPILRIFTLKLPTKPLLVAFMFIFVLSNVIAAVAPNFTVLLISRLCSAAMHAPFFGLSMALAYKMAEPAKKQRALAAVNSGLTIAIMVGVPFGSYLGGMLDWRSVFWLVAILGTISLIGLMLTIPNDKPLEVPVIKKELRVLKNKNLLLVMAIVIFGYSGVFTTYTFKEPILREIAGFSVISVTGALFCFGTGAVIGNFVSGRVRPEILTKRLLMVMAGLTLVILSFTFLAQFAPTAFLASFLLGLFAFGTVPLLNAKMIIAGQEAPSLAGTFAASAFNLANALGALIGTFILDQGASFLTLTSVGAGMTILGLAITVITIRVEEKQLVLSSA
ncbi:MFS transporter [Bacillus sp. IB182487]|uniref:MFS transporter n=2 Tax=Metabacillus arenae TaxID=2771434 RepID=A0A926RXT6_9BACI|nr:MFS transporter [Metabacillus arenae]